MRLQPQVPHFSYEPANSRPLLVFFVPQDEFRYPRRFIVELAEQGRIEPVERVEPAQSAKYGCRPSTDVDTERRMNTAADGDNHIEVVVIVVVVVQDASRDVSRALSLN